MLKTLSLLWSIQKHTIYGFFKLPGAHSVIFGYKCLTIGDFMGFKALKNPAKPRVISQIMKLIKSISTHINSIPNKYSNGKLLLGSING